MLVTRVLPSLTACLLIHALSASPAAALSEVFLHVVDAETGLPLEGASATLDQVTADGDVEYEDHTDAFGFAELLDLAAASYELAVSRPGYSPSSQEVTVGSSDRWTDTIELTPLGGDTRFEVMAQVVDTYTMAQLQGAAVTASYWPSSDDSGAPGAVDVRATDGSGFVTFEGLPSGFYRFDVSKNGWEPTSVPESGVQFLGTGQSLMAGLAPNRGTLTVTVEGYDPVLDLPRQSLAGIMVEIEGVSPLDGEVLVPARATVTNESGVAVFTELPPIPFDLRVARFGYQPSTRRVSPSIDGGGNVTFPDQAVDLVLGDQSLALNVSTVYKVDQALDGLTVLLEGVPGSNSQGIIREVVFFPSESDDGLIHFDNLLPGPYWLLIEHMAIFTDLPREGAFPSEFGPTSFHARFEPTQRFYELLPDQELLDAVALEVDPIRVELHLQALTGLHENARLPEHDEPALQWEARRFEPIAVDGLQFVEHASIDLLERDVYEVDTNADGVAVIELPPGRYGVRIPSLDGLTGSDIEVVVDRLGNVTQASGPWPYPGAWPFSSWEHDLYVGGRNFGQFSQVEHFVQYSSDEDVRLTLNLAPRQIGLSGFAVSDRDVDPTAWGGTVIAHVPDEAPSCFDNLDSVVIPETDMLHHGGQAVLSGAVSATAPLTAHEIRRPYGYFVFDGLGPGSYTLSGSHPRMTFEEQPIEILPWGSPGTLPSVSPEDNDFFIPGLIYQAGWVQATYTTVSELSFQHWVWDDRDERYEQAIGTPFVEYYTVPWAPGRLWKGGLFGLPPTYTAYVWLGCRDYVDKWFIASGSGDQEFVIYEGGISNNVSPANAPPFPAGGYDVEVRTVLWGDPTVEVEGLTVDVGQFDITPVTTPGTLSGFDGAYLSALDSTQWLDYGATRTFDIEGRTIHITHEVDRGMQVVGAFGFDVGPADSALVGILSGSGGRLDRFATDESPFTRGPFRTQPVLVGMWAQGYYPERACFKPPSLTEAGGGESADPDVDFSSEPLVMTPRPGPAATDLSLDRRGVFLPSVRRGAQGDALTMTWEVTVEDAEYAYSLPAGCEEGAGTEDVQGTDPVVEAWLIDRRAFSEPPLSAAPGDISRIEIPESPTNPDVQALLRDLRAGTESDTGDDFFVAHSRSRRRDGDVFTGTLSLADLPPGEFVPMVVLITELGAISYTTFPDLEDPPTGLRLPVWARFVLEAIGTVAAATEVPGIDLSVDPADYVPEGMFIPLPAVEASISADGSGYLNYDYGIAVEWIEGSDAPSSGPLALATSTLGVGLVGELAFSIEGSTTNVGLSAAAELTKDMSDELEQFMVPRGATSLIEDIDASVSASGALSASQYLTPEGAARAETGWEDEGVLPQFVLEGTVTAGGQVEFFVDLIRPFLSKIPYVGPVLLGLKSAGILHISASLGAGLWGGVTRRITTFFPPPPGDSVPLVQPERWTLIGGADRPGDPVVETEYTIEVLASAGLRVRADLGVEASAHGRIQLGPPADGGHGLRLVINPDDRWPYIKRVEGALSATLDLTLDLWITEVGKSYRWDLITIDWQLGTESWAQLQAMTISTTLITPSTADETLFDGNAVAGEGEDGATVIDDLYAAGNTAVVGSGGSGFLAYTDADPDGAAMRVRVAVREGDGWGVPETIAASPGILDLAMARDPAGRWLAVWSELGEGESASAFPSTRLRFSVLGAGGWGAAQTIATRDGAAHTVELATNGEQVILVVLETDAGPAAQANAVLSAVWKDDSWSELGSVAGEGPVLALELSGDPGSDDAVLLLDRGAGPLAMAIWSGASWTSLSPVLTTAPGAFDLAFVGDGDLVLAHSSPDGDIVLSRWDTDAFVEVATSFEGEGPRDLTLATLADGESKLLLLAWTVGGELTDVRFGYVDTDGDVKMSATGLTGASEGYYDHLALFDKGAFAASLLAHYTASPTDVRTFDIVFAPDGACAEGDPCDDGEYCTSGDTCGALGECVSGAPRDCGPVGDACNTGVCDETSDRCIGEPVNDGGDCDGDALDCTSAVCDDSGVCVVSVSAGCAIDGACHSPGDRNPANDCLACDAVEDALGWSPVDRGSECGVPVCSEDGAGVVSSSCSGAGRCEPSESAVTCGSFVCAAGACLADCDADTDCSDDAYCTGLGECALRDVPVALPVADAGADQTVPEGVTVTLDGTASRDSLDEALEFEWSQTGGPAVGLDHDAAPAPTFESPGTPEDVDELELRFQLVVTAGGRASEPDETIVLVDSTLENAPPVALISGPDDVTEGASVTLDGAGSSDPDGDQLTFSWSQPAGPPVALTGAATAQLSWVAPAVRESTTFTFALVVNDGFMNSVVVTHGVAVSPARPGDGAAGDTAPDVSDPQADSQGMEDEDPGGGADSGCCGVAVSDSRRPLSFWWVAMLAVGWGVRWVRLRRVAGA